MFRRFYTPCVITKKFIQRQTTKIQERITPSDILWKLIENSQIKSVNDWKCIRDGILKSNGSFTEGNIDSLTLSVCTTKKEYGLALSYLDYLNQENITLNLAALGKYFKVLYARSIDEELKAEYEDKILALYQNVRQMYPVLDSLTLENIIQAISITREWKLCDDMLKEIKLTTQPSSHAYSALVSAAFLNNADDLAWTVLKEMIENGKPIQTIVYSSYFKTINKRSEPIKQVEILFKFMQDHGLQVESNCYDDFIGSLRKLKISFRSSLIPERGSCHCCNKQLKRFDLTDDEFDNLKKQIVDNVIVGKDIFHKTTSEELERFKEFTSNISDSQFDVVIDGLNVAYSVGVKQSAYVTSGLVATVVSHFVTQGKKVLLFGRNHMNKWPQKYWRYVQDNSKVFLTNNLSHDDPYLLYSALHCGKNTIIVTRDLMRSHKFLLQNVHQKMLFDRWLSQRQYFLIRIQDKGKPIFKRPLPYSILTQKNYNYWHIPYVSPNKGTPNTEWLCIKF